DRYQGCHGLPRVVSWPGTSRWRVMRCDVVRRIAPVVTWNVQQEQKQLSFRPKGEVLYNSRRLVNLVFTSAVSRSLAALEMTGLWAVLGCIHCVPVDTTAPSSSPSGGSTTT